MKNSEIISEIINDLRALQVDDRISSRYVLSKLRDKAALYIKRENDLFRLFDQQEIWTTIDCIEMVPADIVQCCDIQIEKCKFFMRSKYKIPDIYSYRNGSVIREVMSMDGSKNFLPTTPIKYKAILDREFLDKRLKYFWFENGYLIIPDSQVQSIRLTGYFQDISKAKELGCNPRPIKCSNPLDEEFQCPSHLRAIVKQDTITDLFNFYGRKVKDENANDDLNKKS